MEKQLPPKETQQLDHRKQQEHLQLVLTRTDPDVAHVEQSHEPTVKHEDRESAEPSRAEPSRAAPVLLCPADTGSNVRTWTRLDSPPPPPRPALTSAVAAAEQTVRSTGTDRAKGTKKLSSVSPGPESVRPDASSGAFHLRCSSNPPGEETLSKQPLGVQRDKIKVRPLTPASFLRIKKIINNNGLEQSTERAASGDVTAHLHYGNMLRDVCLMSDGSLSFLLPSLITLFPQEERKERELINYGD
ncbi:unnamed protein product [Pleuronectes platessa]|uniref:Uncharacterized protein n=1 Tax=Pleuronectes platessa TaxID=8262 RepID=A0A9N7TUB1_PLEPL|nr:unnamed protein product [Pleuronectes platessa]